MSEYFVYKMNKSFARGYLGIGNKVQFDDICEAGSAALSNVYLLEKPFACYQYCGELERLFRLALNNLSKISKINSISGFSQSFCSRKLAKLNNKTQDYINPSGSK